LSNSDFVELLAEESICPRGPERDDIRHAVTASTIANAHRDVKKRRKPYSFTDFMPFHEKEEKPPMTEEQLKAAVRAINRMLGGIEVPRDGKHQ
jgi:hypothetical protein